MLVLLLKDLFHVRGMLEILMNQHAVNIHILPFIKVIFPHIKLYLLLRQARSCAQSASRWHSDWQPAPRCSTVAGLHEQCATVPAARQMVFGPQGFGVHGSDTTGSERSTNM